jgi:hypothetical protein
VENEPKTVEFLTNDHEYVPPPTPAAYQIPDWLKQMPPEFVSAVSRESHSTVKRCMPFVDAMSCGYVIPIAGDVQFYMADAVNLDIVSPEGLVGMQNEEGFPGDPFGQRIIIKFINPWVVQTPPGYSTLFLPLLNQYTMPFQILAGLVETDTYYNEVYFPAICTMRPGQAFQLTRGTPIVQAIPIKREPWNSAVSQVDTTRLAQVKAAKQSNKHVYREANWEKKTYR